MVTNQARAFPGGSAEPRLLIKGCGYCQSGEDEQGGFGPLQCVGLSVYSLVFKPLNVQLISKASSFPDILGEYVATIGALSEVGVCRWAPRQAQGSGWTKASRGQMAGAQVVEASRV